MTKEEKETQEKGGEAKEEQRKYEGQEKKKLEKEDILKALSEVYDPEIPINIVDMGLVYKVDIDDHNNVEVDMTMTVRGCPMHAFLTRQARDRLEKIKGIGNVKINLVWDPPWTPERISKSAIENLKMEE
ncbi:MAG: DUF59 domain-containing protein [Actinobacteria bacterium]|nr:DUF59 domain-containing protein [Actinomycetota bacterium]